MSHKITRRRFVRMGLLASAAVGLLGCDIFPGPGTPPAPEKPGESSPRDDDRDLPETAPQEPHHPGDLKEGYVPRRRLGRTGLQVSAFALGGAFTLAQTRLREEAAAIIDRAIDLGVNLIDTAPTYGGSEHNIGEVMEKRRKEVYLASKTIDRTYDGTMRLFEQSLRRLHTDYLDIYQLHGIHSDDELKNVLGNRGAVKALEKLKESGAVKFTGITAHKNSSALLRSLEEYPFDCVMLSLNAGDIHDDSFIKTVLPAAVEKDMGILAIKVAAYGRIFKGGGLASMEQALGYVLTHPVSTAVVGISTMEELEENARITRDFTPLPEEQMAHLESLTAPYREKVNFFKHNW